MIKGKLAVLREKKLEDAQTDYAWRTDEELSSLDATTPLKMSYKDYVRMYEDELLHPFAWSKRFAVETLDGKLIGNCMYYDIDTVSRQAELGIMIGDKEYWDQGYGPDIVNSLLEHIFTTTSLKRVYLHTLTWNFRAQKAFQKSGFVSLRNERRGGYDFLLMEILRDGWEALRNGLAADGEAGA